MAERKLFEVEVEETRTRRFFVIAETKAQAQQEAKDEAGYGYGQEWDTSAFATEIEPGKRSLSKPEQDEIPYGDNPDDLTVGQLSRARRTRRTRRRRRGPGSRRPSG